MRPLLLAKVRINIPVSADLATALAVVGAVMTVAMVVFFAWAKIKDDPRTGRLWLGGGLCAIASLLATSLFVSRIGAPGEAYYPVALASILFGIACSWLYKAAGNLTTATVLAALNAMAMLGKLLGRRPLIVLPSSGDDLQIMPAPMTHPMNLTIFGALVLFVALVFWLRRSTADSRPR